MVNFFNPINTYWVAVHFEDQLTEEERDERRIQISSTLLEGTPIFGSAFHTTLDDGITNRCIDFIVVDCSDRSPDPSEFRVQIQVWGDFDEMVDVSTSSVKFAFLNTKNPDNGKDVLDKVNYAILVRKTVKYEPTW